MSAILKPVAGSAMHPDEWQARVQLAACYRVFDLLGWTEMIYKHITVRLPESVSGDCKQFLINPFGLHYSEATASNLLKMGLAQAALGPAIPVPLAVAQQTAQDSFQWDQRFGAGQDVFDALVRRVDRIDASYKD